MPNYEELLRKLIKHYGRDMQMLIALEEMSELQKEICKNRRGRDNVDHIAEEIADVLICIDQLRIMFDVSDRVEEWKQAKLERVYRRYLHGEEGKE